MPYPEPDRFVVGANLPWIGYGTDVGASAWFPAGGLSTRPEALDVLDRTFAALGPLGPLGPLGNDGIAVVRTFLLCDARSGVRFDPHGVPAGLDDTVFADIDALVAAARQHRIRLMPVLLDFHFCGPRRIVDGVQLGGRANVIARPEARQALVDLVLRPILERYGDEDSIAAWDVMNEPEWCLAGGPLGRRRPVDFDALQDFLGEAVACVHASARQPVTVGCADTNRLDLVRPLGLDFYQVHWYESFGWAALEQPTAELELGGAPIILGEFPGRTRFLTRVLDTAKRAGYAAALVWSVLSEDDQSAYPPDLADWVQLSSFPDV